MTVGGHNDCGTRTIATCLNAGLRHCGNPARLIHVSLLQHCICVYIKWALSVLKLPKTVAVIDNNSPVGDPVDCFLRTASNLQIK